VGLELRLARCDRWSDVTTVFRRYSDAIAGDWTCSGADPRTRRGAAGSPTAARDHDDGRPFPAGVGRQKSSVSSRGSRRGHRPRELDAGSPAPADLPQDGGLVAVRSGAQKERDGACPDGRLDRGSRCVAFSVVWSWLCSSGRGGGPSLRARDEAVSRCAEPVVRDGRLAIDPAGAAGVTESRTVLSGLLGGTFDLLFPRFAAGGCPRRAARRRSRAWARRGGGCRMPCVASPGRRSRPGAVRAPHGLKASHVRAARRPRPRPASAPSPAARRVARRGRGAGALPTEYDLDCVTATGGTSLAAGGPRDVPARISPPTDRDRAVTLERAKLRRSVRADALGAMRGLSGGLRRGGGRADANASDRSRSARGEVDVLTNGWFEYASVGGDLPSAVVRRRWARRAVTAPACARAALQARASEPVAPRSPHRRSRLRRHPGSAPARAGPPPELLVTPPVVVVLPVPPPRSYPVVTVVIEAWWRCGMSAHQ
jgi:hypothetical protein